MLRSVLRRLRVAVELGAVGSNPLVSANVRRCQDEHRYAMNSDDIMRHLDSKTDMSIRHHETP